MHRWAGAANSVVPFKLHILNLGTDSDGDAITSCAVGPDTAAVFAPKEPSGARQKAVLKTIRRELSLSGHLGMGGCGPETKCIMVEDAIETVATSLTTTEQKRRRNRLREVVENLIGGGFLKSGLDKDQVSWLWLP